jgi:hypothetical protein
MAKPTSKRAGRKQAMADLKLSAFAMAELMRVPPEQRIGPVIVSEFTGLPYKRKAFNRLLRQITREAGIPDEVQNRDARAGGITKAYTAGAVPDHIRSALLIELTDREHPSLLHAFGVVLRQIALNPCFRKWRRRFAMLQPGLLHRGPFSMVWRS